MLYLFSLLIPFKTLLFEIRLTSFLAKEELMLSLNFFSQFFYEGTSIYLFLLMQQEVETKFVDALKVFNLYYTCECKHLF